MTKYLKKPGGGTIGLAVILLVILFFFLPSPHFEPPPDLAVLINLYKGTMHRYRQVSLEKVKPPDSIYHSVTYRKAILVGFRPTNPKAFYVRCNSLAEYFLYHFSGKPKGFLHFVESGKRANLYAE